MGDCSGMEKEYVKQKIWEGFYELCKNASFEKLTVEKIIWKSGISKATFYRYFHDKYDVLNYHSTTVIERIINEQPCRDWREFLQCMFKEIEREMDYYRKAFKTSGQNAHSRFLFEYSYGIVSECYKSFYGRDHLTIEEHYMISHYCHGCVKTIEDWLAEPDKMSGEQMADLFYQAMPEKIRGTWIITKQDKIYLGKDSKTIRIWQDVSK